MNRREFIETSAGAMGAAMLPLSESPRVQAATRPIGIQVGAVSFLDEGTDRVLDILSETAAVDTLFLAAFTYGRGIGGRQPRGSALPDHGKQEYDDNYHGGIFATPHPQYYRNTSILPQKAPDHPDYDVIGDVLPRARKRGMKVIAWYEDVFRNDVPGLDKAFEVDVHGKPAARVCYRNPNTMNFWLGLTEDFLRSYPLDGLMFGSERQGPLNAAIGASHGGGAAPGTVGCFCPHCLEAAKKEGINAERARQGFLALERWVGGLKTGQRPVDGAFVTFWRVLVEYPEVLAWERQWNEGLRDTYRAMYRKAHEVAPTKPMGWHIWHTNSFAPFYRAEQDYAAMAGYSDFLKVVMYHNCGGPRMATLHPQHQRDAVRGPHTGADDGGDVPNPAVRRRGAARQARDCGSVCRLRDARDQACGGGRRRQDQDLAGHRYRHPDRREREEVDAGGCLSGGQSRGPRRRGRHSALAEVLGDAARQPARSGARRARSGASVVTYSHLSARSGSTVVARRAGT